MEAPRSIQSPEPARPQSLLPELDAIAWASIIVGAFFCFWIGESLLSDTSLITSISTELSYTFRGIGLTVGLIVGIAFAIGAEDGLFKKMLIFLLAPLLVATVFEGLAWRMANMWEFGLSNAPFEWAEYPVKHVTPNTNPTKSWYKKDSLEIDPFDTGIGTDIPVPSDQFEEIWLQADEFCVVVEQRRAPNGAIQIRTKGQVMLGTPVPIELTRCSSAESAD